MKTPRSTRPKVSSVSYRRQLEQQLKQIVAVNREASIPVAKTRRKLPKTA